MILKIAIGIIVVLGALFFITRKVSAVAYSEHTFAAPVDQVWNLWTDPETIKKWWGPNGYSAPIVASDLQVGGKFLLSMKSPSGDMNFNAGTYKEVIPHQKIVQEMFFSDSEGNLIKGKDNKVPGEWPDTLRVTVDFKDLGGGMSHISVRQEGIPLLMKVFTQMGWKQQFKKMDALLKSK